jgi:ABC-type nitrate/sulfonate/bicarbonate transport system permease component
VIPAGKGRDSRLASRSVQAAFLIALVVLWYLATTRWGVSSILLPNPVLVVQQLWDILKSGEFLGDLRVTLTELGIAFAISATSGVTIGYLISRSHYRIRVFEPLFAGIYSVPIILFLPLYVLFFGLGPASKIALGATISFFPITLNTIAGFGYVDRILVVARSMGASDAALPLCSFGGGAADHPHRHAHGLHGRALIDHRQRDHRVAGRARPPHRPSRRRHGDAAHVRLYRLRRRDRTDPQHHRVRARSARKAPRMTPAEITLHSWMRRAWVARIGVVTLLFILWEIAARWWVDPMFLSPPSRVLMSLQAVFDTRGVPRRCGSRSGSWALPSRCRW